MRVFVTGATGFLGSRVVRRLVDRGDDVLALAREGRDVSELEELSVEVVRGDLLEPDTLLQHLRGCDVVYHVGACMSQGADWEEFFTANVECSSRLIDASEEAGVGRLVYVSSMGIFDIDRDGMTISEDSAYDRRPLMRGNYTRSKIGADRVARTAARRGKSVVVVRPGQIYGRGDADTQIFLGRVSKWLRPGLLAVIGSPSYLLPLTYVENVADAVVAAGTVEGVEGKVFNVVDDSDLTQASYFAELAKARSGKLRVLYLPVGLFALPVKAVDILFRLLKGRPWGVAYQLLRSGRNARYDSSAAREVLGWKPRISLAEGLSESLRSRPQ